MLGSMWTREYDHQAKRQERPVDMGEGLKMLGTDFNPLKFDFAPIREFNPLKFEFDMVDSNSSSLETDLLEMLPECMAPEQHVTLPQMGATSHQDVSLPYRMHPNAHLEDSAPAPSLDADTLMLLDSLEMKFSPSSSVPAVAKPNVDDDVSAVVEGLLKERDHDFPIEVPESTALRKLTNIPAVQPKESMSAEELKVMRNKAVQKRYRIRKKTEAKRQNSIFEKTKADLAKAEREAPARHNVVVDKNLLLKKLNGERDTELKRLRKMLGDEVASSTVSEKTILVFKDHQANEGDFHDADCNVFVPRSMALNVVSQAFCRKVVGKSIANRRVVRVVNERFASSDSPQL